MAKKKAPVNEQFAERNAETRRRALADVYKAEPLVPVTISPTYKPHFGSSMSVAINGLLVVVPCDGRVHMIPETFATEVKARIMKIDTIALKQDAMQNVVGNEESSPGALQFF